MDCWPIIPALRHTAHHLHAGVKRAIGHVRHLHHAIPARTGPVVHAAVEMACRKSALFPVLAAATLAGGLLTAHIPPAPSAPSGAPGEDAPANFIPAATWFPQGEISPETSQGQIGTPQTAFYAPSLYPTPPANSVSPLPPQPGGTPPIVTPAGPLIPTTDTAIPEPAPLAAWATGIAALLWVRRRAA